MADFIALCKCNKLLLQEKPVTIFFIFVPKSLKMKLLIIEDNADLASAMKSYLSAEGYSCEVAPTRETAEEKIN
jgi:hypothetical protein